VSNWIRSVTVWVGSVTETCTDVPALEMAVTVGIIIFVVAVVKV